MTTDATLRASLQQSLAAYWDDLSRFDWDFAYSDDHGVYTRGRDAKDLLQRRAGDSTAHRELYDVFADWARERERGKPARPAVSVKFNQGKAIT